MTSRIIDGMAAMGPDPVWVDHERRFDALLESAEHIGAGFDGLLVAAGHVEAPSRADMPAGLLNELAYLTLVQLNATCHDLRHPMMSHAAATHLRPLLEGTALVAFVLGHETDHPIGTAEQRATCVSLARANEEHEAMLAARHDHVPEGNLAESESRIAILEDLHRRLGCPYIEDAQLWPCRKADGTPCGHRRAWPCRVKTARLLTTTTTQLLSQRMNWMFREIEQTASLVVHMMLADRLWRDRGDGTNEFVNATYVLRASTLVLAASAAGTTLAWVMETMSAAAAEAMRQMMRDMWELPDLKEIGTGVWDK